MAWNAAQLTRRRRQGDCRVAADPPPARGRHRRRAVLPRHAEERLGDFHAHHIGCRRLLRDLRSVAGARGGVRPHTHAARSDRGHHADHQCRQHRRLVPGTRAPIGRCSGRRCSCGEPITTSRRRRRGCAPPRTRRPSSSPTTSVLRAADGRGHAQVVRECGNEVGAGLQARPPGINSRVYVQLEP